METKNIAEALSKAQSKIISAIKDAKNPVYNSRYATLSSVWDAVRGPFTDNNIAVVQTVDTEGTDYFVSTTLLHSSGESKTCKMRLILLPRVTKDGRTLPVDMQSLGSAISYARRYQLSAMGCVPQEDDDGNEASNKSSAFPTGTPTNKPKPHPTKPTQSPNRDLSTNPPNYPQEEQLFPDEEEIDTSPMFQLITFQKKHSLTNEQISDAIFRTTGHKSSKQCSDVELISVLNYLKMKV